MYAPADVHNDIEGMAFPFSLQSENLVQLGFQCEVVKQGSLLFNFNEVWNGACPSCVRNCPASYPSIPRLRTSRRA